MADRQALFQGQVDSHRGIIIKVVSAFAWQNEDQQDLSQEITLQLWRAFSRYDAKRPFSTWMYQVALNTAISWSRQAKLRKQHSAPADCLSDLPDPKPDQTDSHALYSLIESLDELSRALLMLYIEERSHTEIGEILGITPNNVAIKLSRLKSRLRLEAGQQN